MSTTDEAIVAVRAAAEAADAVPTTNYLRGPKGAQLTKAELFDTPPPPKMIIAGFLQDEDAGGFVGPGSYGKTTVLLHMAVHVILGLPWCGRVIERTGRVLFLTAEDSRKGSAARLNHICRALMLRRRQSEKVRDGFRIEDVSDKPARIVEADRLGIRATPFVDEIIEKYRDARLALCLLDPASLLGPGELSGNDGMSELMRTARRIARELKCAVLVVHHVAQAVARSDVRDQYAGRGGTAFADNSRSQHQLTRLNSREFEHEGAKYRLPDDAVRDTDLAAGRALAIFLHKLSYAERDPTPLVLVRSGFAFRHVPIAPVDRSPLAEAARAEANRQRLLDYIGARLAEGRRFNRTDLDSRLGEIGLTRHELRGALTTCMQLGLLEQAPLPPSERSTSRKTYLAIGGSTKSAKSAEVRRETAGGLVERPVAGVRKNAADATSTRRRSFQRQKRANETGEDGGSFVESPPSKRHLNGAGAGRA